jgi:hypothetical protein
MWEFPFGVLPATSEGGFSGLKLLSALLQVFFIVFQFPSRVGIRTQPVFTLCFSCSQAPQAPFCSP